MDESQVQNSDDTPDASEFGSHVLDLKNEHILDKIPLYIGTTLFFILLSLALLQVFVREILIEVPFWHWSLVWTEPYARMFLIITSFWGAAIASRNDEHLKITYVTDKSKRFPALHLLIKIIIAASIIGYTIIVIHGSLYQIIDNWDTRIVGLGLLHAGHIYITMLAAMVLMLIYETHNVWKDSVFSREYLQRFRKTSDEVEKETKP